MFPCLWTTDSVAPEILRLDFDQEFEAFCDIIGGNRSARTGVPVSPMENRCELRMDLFWIGSRRHLGKQKVFHFPELSGAPWQSHPSPYFKSILPFLSGNDMGNPPLHQGDPSRAPGDPTSFFQKQIREMLKLCGRSDDKFNGTRSDE